jgi:hypothetical protein
MRHIRQHAPALCVVGLEARDHGIERACEPSHFAGTTLLHTSGIIAIRNALCRANDICDGHNGAAQRAKGKDEDDNCKQECTEAERSPNEIHIIRNAGLGKGDGERPKEKGKRAACEKRYEQK